LGHQPHLEFVQLLHELLLVLLVLSLDDGHLAEVLLDRGLVFTLLGGEVLDQLGRLLDLLLDFGGDLLQDADFAADLVDFLAFGVDERLDFVALLVDHLLLAFAVADLDREVLFVLLLAQFLDEGFALSDVVFQPVALVLQFLVFVAQRLNLVNHAQNFILNYLGQGFGRVCISVCTKSF